MKKALSVEVSILCAFLSWGAVYWTNYLFRVSVSGGRRITPNSSFIMALPTILAIYLILRLGSRPLQPKEDEDTKVTATGTSIVPPWEQ